MKQKRKFIFQSQGFWILSLVFVLQIDSCTVDPLISTETSEINISFQGGPYDGRELKIKTKSEQDDLQFYITKNKTRLFCQPLLSEESRNLNSTSSLNFAWEGGTSPGTFNLINFLNSSSTSAGNLELNYLDGEFLSIEIPKNTLLEVTEYNAVGELVVGSFSFQETLIHEINGIAKSYNVQCFVHFSVQRGADKN